MVSKKWLAILAVLLVIGSAILLSANATRPEVPGGNLVDELAACQAQATADAATIADLRAQLSACSDSLETCKTNLAACQAQVTADAATIADLRAKLSTCSGSLETCKANLAACQAQVTADAATIASLEADNANLQTDLTSCTTDKNTIQGQLDACLAGSNPCGSLDACLAQVDQLTADNDALNGQLAAYTDPETGLKAQFTQLLADNTALKDAEIALKATCDDRVGVCTGALTTCSSELSICKAN